LGAAKARGSRPAPGAQEARLRLITRQSAAGFVVSIKAAPMVGNFRQEMATLSQPWRWLKP
jgi:hypothetical protein